MRSTALPQGLHLRDPRELTGGHSGATTWRATLDAHDVVVKRTDAVEAQVLEALAALDDSHIPPLLHSGVDESGQWIVIPFHPGKTAGVMGGLPLDLHRTMGRIHGYFANNRYALPDPMEDVAVHFVQGGLGKFAPESLAAARPLMGEALFARATALARELRESALFNEVGRAFPSTLTHADLYGENVILADPDHGMDTPWVIDWNSARLGPAMFDVAMTAAFDTPERRAHDEGYLAAAGHTRDEAESRLEHVWSTALIYALYSGVIAQRGSVDACRQGIERGERAFELFTSLASKSRAPRIES